MSHVRLTTVTTTLGPDALEFRRMTGFEQLAAPFEYVVELTGKHEDLKFDEMLAQPVTVHLELQQGEVRHFNGLCSRFRQSGRVGPYALYEATLRPWFWFLTRTSNCRIFQNKSAVDIVKEVFRDRGFSDFSESLTGSYKPMDYCVQYRESDFNFVSRLLEAQGIYYYFKHSEGKHTLVLSDSYNAHDPLPGYKEIPFYHESENVVREEDYIWNWDISREVQSGTFTLNDFDFEKPKAGLVVKSSIQRKHPMADYEVYDYPGDYVTTSQGEAYAKTRIQELQAQFKTVRGKGNPRGMACGGLFSLEEHPRADQNAEHLVLRVEHDVQSQEYASTQGPADGPIYTCAFTAMDSKEVYRPPQLARKPFVQGPQTAIVVGKSGEEIWTDNYGRVKVQFHWDRDGASNENSSCWVRVAQVWAGSGWGAIHVPRMGQEVIVDFLEGDPDRPIITGRVYNQDQMPPYGLPDKGVISGIMSNSTLGGGGYNEYIFDDTKGSELIREHGQKDKQATYENDETHWVKHDRKKTVDNDETTEVKANRTETVGQNETITIKGSREETVEGTETIAITGSRTETVGGAESITIDGSRTEGVGGSESISVKGTRTKSVGGDETTSVSGKRTETVEKDETITVSGRQKLRVEKDLTVSAGGNWTQSTEKSLSLTSDAKGVIEIKEQLTITCGDASIVLKKDGTITIKGKDVTVQGSGKINVKADQDVVLKGSKVLQN